MGTTDIVKEVVQEAPAFELTAHRAVGDPIVCAVGYKELFDSAVGKRWGVSGGGNLFANSEEALLVYLDEKIAVVVFENYYESDRTAGDSIKTMIAYSRLS